MRKITAVFLIFVILAGTSFGILRHLYPKRYSEIVEKYSNEFSIDENLIYTVIHTESGFDPQAVSSVGAIGLMQITEETFDWIKWRLNDEETEFEDLYDPDTAIKYGTYLLSFLFNDLKGIGETAAAYHAGRAKVKSWLSNPEYSDDGITLSQVPTPETRHHVKKIKMTYKIYGFIY